MELGGRQSDFVVGRLGRCLTGLALAVGWALPQVYDNG